MKYSIELFIKKGQDKMNENNTTPTPHIEAKLGDFAETVIMPGDPLRVKHIAENFLLEAKLINSVRGMLGYTGKYKGKTISVMASGMGMPSMGIYSYELFNFYNVKNIIRTGTAGAISDKLHIRDIVIAMASCYNSNFPQQYNLPGTAVPTADFGLLKTAYEKACEMKMNTHVGTILSTDHFYYDEPDNLKKWDKLGILATEMESAALYFNAMRAKKNALCICTISDCPLTGESSSSDERETSFNDMIKLALETAVC